MKPPSTSKHRIKAALHSADGYQGSCLVPAWTKYIAWDGHFYARSGKTLKFIQQNAVARIDKLLPEPRPKAATNLSGRRKPAPL